MRHGRWIPCVVVTGIVASAVGQDIWARPAWTSLQRPSIEIAVRPVADKVDQYECQVTITDLETEQVIATPRVRSLRGETATIKQGFTGADGTDQVVEIILEVASDGRSATYETNVTRGAVRLHRQRVSFLLD